MIQGIYTAAAGMLARLNQLELTGNNLANVDTAGFKQDRLYFRELLAGQAALTHNSGLTGSEEARVDFAQGGFRATSSALDVALDGRGFFVVQAGDRDFYTRNGHFALNENGELVTTQGHKVAGEDGPLIIDNADFKISRRGEVLVNGKVVGKLRIVDFSDVLQLVKRGENLFEAPPALPPVAGAALVRQGFLEESNVDALQLLVELIDIQHVFDSSQRAMHAEDETLRRAVNDLGKV